MMSALMFLANIHTNIDYIDMCMCLYLHVRFSHVIWCDIGPADIPWVSGDQIDQSERFE